MLAGMALKRASLEQQIREQCTELIRGAQAVISRGQSGQSARELPRLPNLAILWPECAMR